MSDSTARRRRRRKASSTDVEKAAAGRASIKLRVLGFLVALALIGGAIQIAGWQPSQAPAFLSPAWDYTGPALLVVPLFVVGLYLLLRVFGLNSARVWRLAGAGLFAIGAALAALHYFEVTEIQGVSIAHILPEVLVDFSSLQQIGVFAGLTLITFALLTPIGMFRAARASGRAARSAGAAGASATVAGGAAAGRGIRSAAASRPSRDEEDERAMPRIDEAPIPRTRIVVPEPSSDPVRPRYPEPIGFYRDKQKQYQQERDAETQSQPTERPRQQRPVVFVRDAPTNEAATAPARDLPEHFVRADATISAEEAANEEGAALVEEKRPLPLPPPGLSSVHDLKPGHLTHSDVEGEGFGMDPSEVHEMGQQDPLAFSDDDADDDVDDSDDFWDSAPEQDLINDDAISETISVTDDVTAMEPSGDSLEIADGVEEDEEEPSDEAVATGARSDSDLLESLDPFTGLPKVAWKFPSFKLFDEQPPIEVDTESHLETAEAIQDTLQEYGVEVEVTEVRPGPTVTLYGLRPGWERKFKNVRERNEEGEFVTRRQETQRKRVKVDAIAKLDEDLALQLKATSVRIEPIPGTDLVGVEVPNMTAETVYMRPQLESDAYRRARGKSKLAFPLGKGSGGESVVADLARMPHLLVAGSTGSGKSVFVNSLITSLITRAAPEELRFVMIDPKRVELTIYDGIPHLITPVIVDTQKVVNALQWTVQQMEERLELLAQQGARDIASYNEKVGDGRHMPYLVLIVDELADLMMTSGKAVEHGLVRLAQMGRATGIHLVVATQRPSVNVITGLIKANFPTRISFMVTSLVDSRTILDGAGAEKLLGRGDMLYLPQDASRPIRIQSAFISSHESDAVVEAWRAQSRGYVPPELPDLVQPEDIGLQSRGRNGTDGAGDTNGARRTGSGGDDIMEQARELADIYKGKVSTSLLQRRLGIGYPRAARLRDRLVEEGLAGAEIPNAPAETGGRGLRRTREAAEESEEN